MDELALIIRQQLKDGGKVEFTPRGTSMLPMLRDNKDAVLLESQNGKLKKYDLPFYQCDNGKYVLHRVVKVCQDGSYIMCGDNQIHREQGIKDKNIIGVVTEFKRKGKRYSCDNFAYRVYCHVWCFLFPLRKLYKILRAILRKTKRFVKRKIYCLRTKNREKNER